MSKKYNEPIRVWSAKDKLQAFVWRGKLYRVQQVIESWTVNSGLWQKTPDNRRHTRVAASCNYGSGVFELYFEGMKKQWFLFKVVD